MKRILSLFLCIVLFVSAFAIGTPVSASDGAAITVMDALFEHGAHDTVKVKVKMTANPGVMYLLATPSVVDEEGNTVEGISWTATNGYVFDDMEAEKNLAFLSSENENILSTVCDLTLTVADTVKPGTYTVKFKVRECFDYDENAVEVTVTDGTLTVKEKKSNLKLEYTASDYVKGSGTLDITVEVTDNPGIMTFILTPTITDKKGNAVSGFSWTAVNGDVFTETTIGSNILFMADENISATGELIKLSFSVDNSVPDGVYTLKLDIRDCMDEDGEDVPTAVYGNAIKISSPVVKTYKVSFIDWDGSIIAYKYYNDGEAVEIPAAPARADDDSYTYTFAGWSPEVALTATAEAVYQATYKSTPKVKDLEIELEYGSPIKPGQTTFVAASVTANPGICSMTLTPVIKDGAGNVVTSNFSVSAVNGTVMTELTSGKNFVFANSADSKENGLLATFAITAGDAVAAGRYTFSLDVQSAVNYDEKIVSVKIADAEFIVEEKPITQYTVKFVDWNDSVISTAYYNIGDEIVAPASPTRPADDKYTYTFAGWSPSLAAICTGDAVYKARYTETPIVPKESVKIEVGTNRVFNGASTIIPIYITKNPGFMSATFTAKIIDEQGNAVPGITVKDVETGDVFKASEFTIGKNIVVLANADNNKIGTFVNLVVSADASVPYGTYTVELITRTCTDSSENDVTVDIISGSLVVTEKFTVRFVNWDGTLISSADYASGDEVTLPEAIPVKPSDLTYTYTFNTWTPEVTPVTGNATYTATYTPTFIDYTVKFVDEDGTELSSNTYHYGDTVVAPAAPTKAADKTYTYAFAGWDNEVVTVAGNATYTATYASTFIDYTVKFVDEDGTELSSDTYHYGDTVVAPTAPTKAEDDTYTYTFAGWDKEIETVTQDVTYTATYKAERKFIWGDANGDGIVDNKDLVRVKKYIAGFDYDTGISAEEVSAGADANGDGTVDNKDLVRLKKYIAAYDYDTGTSDVVLGPTA